jgi:hypothetical protein
MKFVVSYFHDRANITLTEEYEANDQLEAWGKISGVSRESALAKPKDDGSEKLHIVVSHGGVPGTWIVKEDNGLYDACNKVLPLLPPKKLAI